MNEASTTDICTLSLHDALPILETLRPQIAAKGVRVEIGPLPRVWGQGRKLGHVVSNLLGNAVKYVAAEQGEIAVSGGAARSEEHTSELQSHVNLVCRLLLEKKK